MKRIKQSLNILLLALVMLACSTGQNAFKKGDYYTASIQAINRLRSNPNSENSRNTIKQSYPMAINYFQKKIDDALMGNMPFKYSYCLENYMKMDFLADEIMRCPAALEEVGQVTYYTEQMAHAKGLAAKEQYQAGLKALNMNTMADSRKAYGFFKKTLELKPDLLDAKRQMNTAEDRGTLKVVIEQEPVASEYYKLTANDFYTHIYAYLKKHVEKQFLEFYKPSEAEDFKIKPHHIVRMKFNDFVIGNTRDKEVEKEYHSDSLKVGEYTDSKGVKHDVMGTVKAKVNHFVREVSSKGILQVEIIDFELNKRLDMRQIPGEYVWGTEWATFEGDTRALPGDIAKLVKLRPTPPPAPQDLFVMFTEPIMASTNSYLRSYYRKP